MKWCQLDQIWVVTNWLRLKIIHFKVDINFVRILVGILLRIRRLLSYIPYFSRKSNEMVTTRPALLTSLIQIWSGRRPLLVHCI
jgi:hypothetical protein